MEWVIQYRFGAAEHQSWHRNLDEAIDSACVLIDSGSDVIAIGHQTLDNAIGEPEIQGIYSIRMKAKVI
jgi:hypothetical protein